MAEPAIPDSERLTWTAGIACFLGVLSLVGVLCFHFPEWLTSREFRAVYTEGFARGLLLSGLVAAFVLGTWSLLAGRARRVALVAVGSATLALLLGGATVPLDRIEPAPFSFGLDWFAISLFATALVFVPVERALAARPQDVLRPEWRTDLAYFFVGHVLIQAVLISVTAITGLALAWVAWEPLARAVGGLPWWLQFPLAVLVADLAQALLHRAYHRVPWLWRFHAVHHSSRHIDWLAGSRMHLVEVMLTRSLVLLPLLALGFSPGVVNAYVVLVGVQAVLAHANLGIDFGWLERVVVLPRYHHWHHARDPAYADANYAIHLPLVDRLMGTYRLPTQGWPEEYGLHDPTEVPSGIVAQHLAPFLPRRAHPGGPA
jgi:lathosterol oxidase